MCLFVFNNDILDQDCLVFNIAVINVDKLSGILLKSEDFLRWSVVLDRLKSAVSPGHGMVSREV